MLPRQMFRAALTAAVVLSTSAANAQFYGDGCSSCGPVAAPVASCTPIQPVQTTCYQTVPVTTYRQEKQTVKEPYYRTTYEDREVTVMTPVTTSREIEIPTVRYRTVTENRTVHRDMGRWITRYTPVQKCSPCQVDARPGLIGWLNRTGYSFRTAFRPNYYTSRQYVPNMMACTVPVSRQVAVRGTERVTVQETKMVAKKKMERVAVQKLDYRERVVTVTRPQVAYRTVPIGSQLAYGYGGYGYGSATAFAPILESRTALTPEPDPISGTRSALRDEDDSKRPFPEDSEPEDENRYLQRSSHTRELEPVQELEPFDDFQSSSRDSKKLLIPATYTKPASSAKPTPTGSAGWSRTSRKTALRSSTPSDDGGSQVTLTQKSGN